MLRAGYAAVSPEAGVSVARSNHAVVPRLTLPVDANTAVLEPIDVKRRQRDGVVSTC